MYLHWFSFAVHAGAASTSGHKSDPDPLTTANEAYGMHSALPVSIDQTETVLVPVYETVRSN